jgi:transmembrane sensor
MRNKIDPFLLKRYLEGNCTAQEKGVVEQLLQTAEGRAQLQSLMQDRWEESGRYELPREDIDKWKQEFWNKVADMERKEKRGRLIGMKKRELLRYAAVLVPLIVMTWIGAAVYRNAHQHTKTASLNTITKENSKANRSTFILSDGTTVHLGRGSKLKFPEIFADTREVELEGEAYFDVAKNAAKPFIIHAGQIDTKVLGTSFRIRSFDSSDIEVGVATGKVEVSKNMPGSGSSVLAVLTKGMKMNYSSNKAVVAAVNPTELEEWKTGILSFEATTTADVVKVLQRSYDIDFEFKDPALRSIPLTLSVRDTMPADKVAKILSLTGGFNYEKVGSKIVFY